MVFSLTALVSLLTLGLCFPLSAAPADVISVAVEPNGWVLDVTMVQPLTNSTTFDYGFTSQPAGGCTMVGISLGKMTVAMTAAGFDDNEQPTTFSRTVYGTRTLRYPYGMNGQTTGNYIPDVTNTNGNTIVRLALSEYIYQTDSNLLFSVGANWYCGNAAVTNLTVTNNSTNIVGRVVGNWSRPPYQRITNSTATVACTAFGHGAQSGRPVRCVQFWAVDEFNNTSPTNTALEASVDSTQGDAVPVIEYIGHIDCSSLAQSNRLTVHFAAYPWIGDARSVLNTSDGRYNFPSVQAAPTRMFLDKSNSYPVQIAVVSPTGSDSSGQVVSAASFNANSPPPAFATTGQAATAIAAKNQSLYGTGMRDTGAGIVYLQPGSHVFGSPNSTSLNYPKTWLTIAPFPNVDRSQVVITTPGALNFVSQMTHVYNCTFLSSFSQLMGQTDFLWLDHCLISSNTTSTALIDSCTNWYVTQCIVQDLPQGLSPAVFRYSNVRLIRGNNISGMVHDWFPSTFIGNARVYGTNGASRTDWNDSTSHDAPSYPIVAFNTLFCENGMQGGDLVKLARPSSYMRITNGAAIVQNVIEQVNENPGAVRCMSVGSTSTSVNDTNNADNVICWNNTIVGQRVNWLENAGSNPGVAAQRNVASLVNNVIDQLNAKDDLDYTASGVRTGNWPVMYGVNSSANTDLDVGAIDSGWHWSWFGLNSISNRAMAGIGPSGAWATYFAFTDRESGTAQGTGNAKGNGDYHLQPSSPLWSVKTRWVLPYDIEGKRRSINDPPGAYASVGSTNQPAVSPSINSQPQGLNINQGSNAIFTVTASGTAPLNYQWRFNGTAISGANSTSLTITNAQSSDAGSYSAFITNVAGSAISSDAILIVNVSPSIKSQPQNVSTNQGNTVTFTVSASGTAPLNFQWRFNGAAIPGATSTNFTIGNAQSSDAGSYSAVVTNVAGVATSADAVLTVNVPPSIATQPQSVTGDHGANATFTVAGSGSAPFTYQWQLNSVAIPGATSSSYTRNNIQSSDAGSYSVVVADAAGSITSADATLTLRPCIISLQNAARNPDGTVVLTWNVDTANAYDLQTKNTLLDPQWTTITTLNATSTLMTVSDGPVTNNQRFYRLTSSCAVSDPAGLVQVSLPGNSDSYISLPFIRAPVASAIVDSVSNNIVTVQNSPNWAQNQFVYSGGASSNTYCLRFNSGAAEGGIYFITANGNNSLNLNLNNDSLALAARNDLVSIVPCWTFGTVFPNGAGVNISPTTGNRNTEVLVTDPTAGSINIGATRIYYFNGGVWKLMGQGSVDHHNDVIGPNSSFIVRHNVATNTTVTFIGSVVVGKIAIPLNTSATDKQDNFVGLARPAIVSLNDSQLVSSGAFASSPLPGTHTDELLTFDNTVAERNKSTTGIYFYWNNAWRRVGAGAADVGTDLVFTPGAGVVIRKATNSTVPVWVNSPNF